MGRRTEGVSIGAEKRKQEPGHPSSPSTTEVASLGRSYPGFNHLVGKKESELSHPLAYRHWSSTPGPEFEALAVGIASAPVGRKLLLKHCSFKVRHSNRDHQNTKLSLSN